MGIFMLLLQFSTVTETFDLPRGLLSSLCFVESSHKIKVVHYNDGGADSIGVCQIKLDTARSLGFKGTKQQLLDPKNNIYWAGKYLSKQMKRYDNDIVKAVAAYNAGRHIPGTNGFPINRKYVRKVFKAWADGR